MSACPLFRKVFPLEKQPLPTACFEDAFIEYLGLRFEAEPLPHYAFAAMHLCDTKNRDYPQFVRDFMMWFNDSFLFEERGVFPAQSHNADPTDARWRRYEDCHALLEGCYSGDLKAALNEQSKRLKLVEEVQRLRLQKRDDPMGKDLRQRKKTTMTDAELFEKLENLFGEREHTLRRKFKKLADPKSYMSGVIPVALVKRRQGYETKCIEMPLEGESWPF